MRIEDPEVARCVAGWIARRVRVSDQLSDGSLLGLCALSTHTRCRERCEIVRDICVIARATVDHSGTDSVGG